jgi:hypothetical protein
MAFPTQTLRPFVGGKKYAIGSMDRIVQKLNREINAIKGRSLKGLIRAQAKIRQDMDSVPPTIPVDTENLRNSYFAVTSTPAVVAGASINFDNKNNDAIRLSNDHVAAITEQMVKAFTLGKERGPQLIMGFSAYYAIYVHERPGTPAGPIKWTRPGSGPKFFQAALNRNARKIIQLIREEARIRK